MSCYGAAKPAGKARVLFIEQAGGLEETDLALPPVRLHVRASVVRLLIVECVVALAARG
jgi:hypothetical protein